MRRREFLGLLGGAVAVAPVLAPMSLLAGQSAPAIIGILNAASAASVGPFVDAFRDAMRERGYVEGRNIHFEYRFADGVIERLPDWRPTGPSQPKRHRLGATARQLGGPESH